VTNKQIIDFDQIRFPCKGEFLEKGTGIWLNCLVLGYYQRGSSATPFSTLEGFWGVTDLEGINHEIIGFQNVRFSIHRNSS
jgi:hypothetical protein